MRMNVKKVITWNISPDKTKTLTVRKEDTDVFGPIFHLTFSHKPNSLFQKNQEVSFCMTTIEMKEFAEFIDKMGEQIS